MIIHNITSPCISIFLWKAQTIPYANRLFITKEWEMAHSLGYWRVSLLLGCQFAACAQQLQPAFRTVCSTAVSMTSRSGRTLTLPSRVSAQTLWSQVRMSVVVTGGCYSYNDNYFYDPGKYSWILDIRSDPCCVIQLENPQFQSHATNHSTLRRFASYLLANICKEQNSSVSLCTLWSICMITKCV